MYQQEEVHCKRGQNSNKIVKHFAEYNLPLHWSDSYSYLCLRFKFICSLSNWNSAEFRCYRQMSSPGTELINDCNTSSLDVLGNKSPLAPLDFPWVGILHPRPSGNLSGLRGCISEYIPHLGSVRIHPDSRQCTAILSSSIHPLGNTPL